MARVELAAAAVKDVRALTRTHSLPADTQRASRGRCARLVSVVLEGATAFTGYSAASVACSSAQPCPHRPGRTARRSSDDFDLFDQASVGSPAAVVAEPVLSAGGVIGPPPGYFPRLAELARERQLLLVIDECQPGLGRLGRMSGGISTGGNQTPHQVSVQAGSAGRRVPPFAWTQHSGRSAPSA